MKNGQKTLGGQKPSKFFYNKISQNYIFFTYFCDIFHFCIHIFCYIPLK